MKIIQQGDLNSLKEIKAKRNESCFMRLIDGEFMIPKRFVLVHKFIGNEVIEQCVLYQDIVSFGYILGSSQAWIQTKYEYFEVKENFTELAEMLTKKEEELYDNK